MMTITEVAKMLGVSPCIIEKWEKTGKVKKLQKKLLNLKFELKKIPDVRKEKVKDVNARIESGFYDKKKIIEKVASSIKEAGLRPLGP